VEKRTAHGRSIGAFARYLSRSRRAPPRTILGVQRLP